MTEKSKFSRCIWLYASIVFIIVLTLFLLGVAAPYLISAPDTILFCAGVALVVIYPILAAVWIRKFINSLKKVVE